MRLLFLAALMLSVAQASPEKPVEKLVEKPKYGSGTIPLSIDYSYVKQSAAPDFWALMPQYLAQRDGRSCSLASFATVLNSLRGSAKLGADDRLITQNALLDQVDHPAWNRMFKKNGKTAGLDEFGQIAEKALKHYRIACDAVEVVRVQVDVAQDPKAWTEIQDRVRKILVANEASAQDRVILNALQSELTGDPEGKVGHVMSIGAYDAKRDRVLILDPDREYYEPYWVGFAQLMNGMNTFDSDSGKNRGLIWINGCRTPR
jgi:hypothetical protein